MINLRCTLLGHYYLPEKRVWIHYSSEEEIDYLKCSRCGQEYYFAFNEYWHVITDRKKWADAKKRAIRSTLQAQEIREHDQLGGDEVMQSLWAELASLIDYKLDRCAQAEKNYQKQIARGKDVFEARITQAKINRDEALLKEEKRYRQAKKKLEDGASE